MYGEKYEQGDFNEKYYAQCQPCSCHDSCECVVMLSSSLIVAYNITYRCFCVCSLVLFDVLMCCVVFSLCQNPL